MRRTEIYRSWLRVLAGYPPVLSIELTKVCPLSCPGCYAYQPEHVSGSPLVSLSDYQGEELVRRVLELIDRTNPVVVFLVGGEPLVRFRELNDLLPRICCRNLAVELVTSAVRPIPAEWADLKRLRIVVSVDGLAPEHDERRKPATYERILKHIRDHRIFVHCTVTGQMTRREDYLEEFLRFWSDRPEVARIRLSFYTPQVGETSTEKLTPEMRRLVVEQLRRLRPAFPKLELTPGMLDTFLNPPESPDRCLFARNTLCVSADLQSVVTPCQFGGTPSCSECGCAASIGLHTLGNHRVPGGIQVRTLFEVSQTIGTTVRRIREAAGKLRENAQ